MNKLPFPKKNSPAETTGIDRTNAAAISAVTIQKVKFEESTGKDVDPTSGNGRIPPVSLVHSNVTGKIEPIESTASAIVIQEGLTGGKYNKAKNAPEAPPQTKLKVEENVNTNILDTNPVAQKPDCPEDNSDSMKKMKRQTSKGWL